MEKLLGFLYRVFMSRTIGAEGIGIYQVALSVFALLLTITCSGTPITVSRLMTKYKSNNDKLREQRVISAGLSVSFVTAVILCVPFFFLKDKLGFIFADDRCATVFIIVLPGLVFTSVYAVLRGVFWGNKDFLPYSVIELLEELCMIVVGIILISLSSDAYHGAISAGIAVLVSYLLSFTLASVVFFARKNKIKNPRSELKPLLSSSTPITAMRTTNSLAVSLVSVILPMRLVASGMTSESAMSAFGSAVGQAMPILFIPTTLIGSFTLVLVPEIAENFYGKKFLTLKNNVDKAVKFSVLISCLFIPVFCVCGEEIGIIVFGNHESGKYLSVSSFLMLFMSLSNITTSILNSIGLERRTLLYYVVSGTFMLLSVWFLPRYVGVYALLIGFTFVYGITTVLNILLIRKHCPKKPEFMKFILYSVGFLIPACLLGFMLERLLTPVLGIFFTFLFCSVALLSFSGALYAGFGLVSPKSLALRLKSVFKKKKGKAILSEP